MCPCVYLRMAEVDDLVSASGSAPSLRARGLRAEASYAGTPRAYRKVQGPTVSTSPRWRRGANGKGGGVTSDLSRDWKRGDDPRGSHPTPQGVAFESTSVEGVLDHEDGRSVTASFRGRDLGGHCKGSVRLRGRSNGCGDRDRGVKRRTGCVCNRQANTLSASRQSRRSGLRRREPTSFSKRWAFSLVRTKSLVGAGRESEIQRATRARMQLGRDDLGGRSRTEVSWHPSGLRSREREPRE